jgi:hypothetical protein
MLHAMNGRLKMTDRQYLQRMLEMLDALTSHLQNIESDIKTASSSFALQIELL